MTFLELAKQVLKDEKRPLTATEIWTIAEAKGYDKKLVNRQHKVDKI
jgi:hypothetical protein